MKKRRAVALLVERSNEYCRDILRGIRDYLKINPYWSIYLPEHERETVPKWLSQWDGDGIITRLETQELADIISSLNVPIVNLSVMSLMPGVPSVTVDNDQVAKIAADYLIGLGYRNFGFCGDPGFRWSTERQDAFVACLSQHEFNCEVYQSDHVFDPGFSWNVEREKLMSWLVELHRPCAILACHDIKAQKILDSCRELGIAVPEEISVLGVDNDELVCDFSHPTLSSICLNTRRVGFVAADMLTKMMTGTEQNPESLKIHPSGIRLRQSSGSRAVDDPFVAHALTFIREFATSGINVTDILNQINLSRRSLEHRFMKTLGRSPHEEITRVKVSEAKRLLTETDLSVGEVAVRCGYEQLDYFSVAFKREVGVSPKAFKSASH